MRIKHTNNQPFSFAYVVTLDGAYSRLLSHHNAYLRVRSNKMLSNNNSKVFYRELLIALLCQGIHLFTITTINIVNYNYQVRMPVRCRDQDLTGSVNQALRTLISVISPRSP